MIAEIQTWGGQIVSGLKASMRPRSDDRGNIFPLGIEQGRWAASMRPRSDDRGNDHDGIRGCGGKFHASMRPRSDDRGNLTAEGLTLEECAQLQ